MFRASPRPTLALLIVSIALTTTAQADFNFVAEPLFAPPADVPVNGLVPPPSPTYVAGFGGQPRIDNDGTWYALYAFPIAANPTPIEFTRDYVMLSEKFPYIREGLQLPNSTSYAPIADYALSQNPFFDISIAGDGTVAQIIKGTTAFGLLGDGTPNPDDLAFPTDQHDLLVVDRAVIAEVGTEVDILPGVVYPRNAIESLSTVKAASATKFVIKADLDTAEDQFASDTTVIYELTDPGTMSEAVTLRFTNEDTLPMPDLGYNVATFNSNEEDIDANADGSILVAVDIEGAPYNLDGAIIFYNALTDTYEQIAREGDPSPIPGRIYDGLFNKPLALNDNGDIAFLASIDGDYDTDGILVRNGQVVIQEDDIVGTAVPGPLQLGFANANIEMDAAGNIVWYGAWNELKENVCPNNPHIGSSYVIFEGLFFNDQVLIEGGVTEVHDVWIDGNHYPTLVVMDLPNNGHGGFNLSPDGRWLIVHALLAEPSPDICTFSVNNDNTPVAQVLMRIDLAALSAEPCPGDSNCDGFVNFRDIDFFVAAQNDNVAAWEALFGGTPPCDFANNDANGDGFVNFRDIDPFVALQNTTCP